MGILIQGLHGHGKRLNKDNIISKLFSLIKFVHVLRYSYGFSYLITLLLYFVIFSYCVE